MTKPIDGINPSIVKNILVGQFPDLKSSHISEALAHGAGYRSNAGYVADLRSSTTIRFAPLSRIDAVAMSERLSELSAGGRSSLDVAAVLKDLAARVLGDIVPLGQRSTLLGPGIAVPVSSTPESASNADLHPAGRAIVSRILHLALELDIAAFTMRKMSGRASVTGDHRGRHPFYLGEAADFDVALAYLSSMPTIESAGSMMKRIEGDHLLDNGIRLALKLTERHHQDRHEVSFGIRIVPRAGLQNLGISKTDMWQWAASSGKGVVLVCGAPRSGRSTTIAETLNERMAIMRHARKGNNEQDLVAMNAVVTVHDLEDASRAFAMGKEKFVFAKMQAPSIAAAIKMLLGFGIDAQTLASSLRGGIAQVLIPRTPEDRRRSLPRLRLASEVALFEKPDSSLQIIDAIGHLGAHAPIPWTTIHQDILMQQRTNHLSKEAVDAFYESMGSRGKPLSAASTTPSIE